jgi:3-methylcrotonyl-CoA carboxylase alpha subunit
MKKLLIANRGEIACRIIRTARSLGIQTVAVYSDPDRNALHVRTADEAVALGGSETRESYLVVDKILNAVKSSGADAVHPGYGFLSENAVFAERLRAEGILFLGPSPEAMRKLGDKVAAKTLAAEHGVPLLPSQILPHDATPEGAERLVQEFVTKHGLPIIIKAAAGGGGRGMRKVRKIEELRSSLESARREALSFFGDGRVFVEKLLERARHIEVQILGDQHGNVTHLYDRDCSLQRNHQKVIEEAPAYGLAPTVRAALHESAVRLGTAANYSGAGTVEFLYDSESFYLLEVNSRLQVEHPVTEMITGHDLVALQIEVARGRNLKTHPVVLPPLEGCGHAIECRVCFENPDRGFGSATGKLTNFHLPTTSNSGCRVRVDTGFEAGDAVSHYYDSLGAKLIVASDTRQSAIAGAVSALRSSDITGVYSNLGFLRLLLDAPEFRAFDHHINWAVVPLAYQPTELRKWFESWCSLLVSGGMQHGERAGWRLNGGTAAVEYRSFDETPYRLTLSGEGATSYRAELLRLSDGETLEQATLTLPSLVDGALSLTLDGKTRQFRSCTDQDATWVSSELGVIPVRSTGAHLPRSRDGRVAASSNTVRSPLPGKIVALKAAVGERIISGAPLAVLESMKMEHVIVAPHDGTVTKISVVSGQVVESRAEVAVVEQ